MRILIIDPSVKNSKTKTNAVNTIEYAAVEHGMYLLRKETFDYVIFDLIYDTVERILNNVDGSFSTWIGRSQISGSQFLNQLINLKELESLYFIKDHCIEYVEIERCP